LANKSLSDAPDKLWCIYQQSETDSVTVFFKCDVQGPGCKIWYHPDCVGNNKSGKKLMEQNSVDAICPVCTIAHDSTESA